jgi:hypothetical protein
MPHRGRERHVGHVQAGGASFIRYDKADPGGMSGGLHSCSDGRAPSQNAKHMNVAKPIKGKVKRSATGMATCKAYVGHDPWTTGTRDVAPLALERKGARTLTRTRAVGSVEAFGPIAGLFGLRRSRHYQLTLRRAPVRLTKRLPRIIIPSMSFLSLMAMAMPMRALSRAVAVARLG